MCYGIVTRRLRMVDLWLGNINNTELKFIVTKRTYFYDYFSKLNLIEKYNIEQFFIGEVKYRKYIFEDNTCRYTRNIKNGKITNVTEITETVYNEALKIVNKILIKTREYYSFDGFDIDVDYIKCANIIIVEVSSKTRDLKDYIPCRGMIDVTNNSKFKNINIFNNSIKLSDIIIEGTDFTGKTSTITQLLDDGIVCQDRNEYISSLMLFSVKLEDRIKGYREFLNSSHQRLIVLINNDEQELLRRMRKRESEGDTIDEWDLQAYAFNGLYYQTFQTMLNLNICTDSFSIVDVTCLDEIEQYKKVKQIITMKFL